MEAVNVPWETVMGKVKNYIHVVLKKWRKMKMLLILRQLVTITCQVLCTACILNSPFLVLGSEECTIIQTCICLVSSGWNKSLNTHLTSFLSLQISSQVDVK